MHKNWFQNKASYKNTYNEWHTIYNEKHNILINDIHELSKKIEFIFDYRFFKKYNSPFIEDIIWVASQARVHDSYEIHKSIDTFIDMISKEINRYDPLSDSYGTKFHQMINTILAITIENMKKYDSSLTPSITGCLSLDEVKKIKNKLLFFSEQESLNDMALSMENSAQMQILERYIKSPNIEELKTKINLLLDISTTDSDLAIPASASINYLLDNNDVIDDKIGILGLVDDMLAIEEGIKKIQPDNKYYRLINEHNKNYPSFDLPIIDSTVPISLINLENIVKASYTKIDSEPVKRLMILPETGPLHILCAIGKAITNRIEASSINDSSVVIQKGQKILIGEIEAKNYGNVYKKNIIVEFDSQSKRAPHLFYVKTDSQERQTISKDIIESASICINDEKLSKNSDLKEFKKNFKQRYIPWGTMEFNKNIKNVIAKKKIFIFCKKNNLSKYLEEEIYGQSLKAWFGLRYFKKDFQFIDSHSSNSLFPEPMFFSASNIDIAMEMIRGKFQDAKAASEPSIIIINEPTWLRNNYFLKLLEKTDHNIIVINNYLRKSNEYLAKSGFEKIAVKPDKYITIDTNNNLDQGLIEKFLLKNQKFKIIKKIINTPALDELHDVFRKTSILEKQENFFLKVNISRFLRSIRSQITPIETKLKTKYFSDLSKLVNELSFMAKIEKDFLELSNLMEKNLALESFIETNRSDDIKDCIENIDPNKKTRLVVKPAQYNDAKKFFSDFHDNFDVILASSIEDQRNIDNLIIPYFLGREYSSMLRNFKFAENHIFIMSKTEERIHDLMIRHDKAIYENYFSDKKSKKREEAKILPKLEDEINFVDPSANIFKQSIEIISKNLGSKNETDNIESRIFSFENDQTLILPLGGDALIMADENLYNSPELVKVSSINVGDKIIIQESFSGSDILEAILNSDIDEYNKYKNIQKNSALWQKALRKYKDINEFNFEDLHLKLKHIGINRDKATIKSWINNPSIIAPRNRAEVIPKIFNLNNSAHDEAKRCLDACSKIYLARNQAKKQLISSVENTKIEKGQKSFSVQINDMQFKFMIFSVESLADINVGDQKYLYHLRSYEDIQELQI